MSWQKFKKYFLQLPELNFSMDVSRMDFDDAFIEEMKPQMDSAFESMEELEKGAISNPDEGRMVGHYWLRNHELAPEESISLEIDQCVGDILELTAKVHGADIQGEGGSFTDLLIIGIGGSALGPQFVSQALGGDDILDIHFFDNTDPDGMDRTIASLGDKLSTTLSVVISKSGGTPETRNGMLEAQSAYKKAGLDFAKHAIAITGVGSKLDKVAETESWIARLPMWDWVGGRTSELAAVGLLPAALQGIDIDAILRGASMMDEATRVKDSLKNPAALLALMWFYATNGKGEKDMVILPYKDRLALFSKYLQQLIMESLGKELDLDGKVVHQGIAVYGNKGSTDQHAYVQQLREGVNNFFATFIEVLSDRKGDSIEVDPGVTSGDYLQGFLLGSREALYDNGRESITLTVDSVTPEIVGALIALYERAVGLYASLVNINAYHQPGVEAGKKAAATILDLKLKLKAFLSDKAGESFTVDQIAESLSSPDQVEMIFKLLEHLTANSSNQISKSSESCPLSAKYSYNKV